MKGKEILQACEQAWTMTTNKWWQWWNQAKQYRLKSGPPVMKRLGIHKTVSDIKLMLATKYVGLALTQQWTNSSQLTQVLSCVYQRWACCLRQKNKPAFIIKPRLILVSHTDNLCWNIRSNQQRHMLIQNLTRNTSRPNITPGQILFYITNCIPIDFMLNENFHTNTHVWNILSHQNDCWQRRVILVTYGCYKSNPYFVRNISHQ